MNRPPYRTLSSFLKERFGQNVRKITLDAGLSCPNRDGDKKGGCIYCNDKGSGTGAARLGLSLKEQIDARMSLMARRYKTRAFIAYFQSFSNTYADIETLKHIFDTILPYPGIVGLAVGTRPDCVDGERLCLMASYAEKRLVWMEYGLQSANDRTLELINRGHDARAFAEAAKAAHALGLRVCAHVIIGLPGEGFDDWLHTARFLSGLPVTDVKIHLLYIVKGTTLERMYEEGRYRPLTGDVYAGAVAAFIAHLRSDIVVQRITGDPHPEELIEPVWALDKAAVRAAVHREMELSNLRQGCLCG